MHYFKAELENGMEVTTYTSMFGGLLCSCNQIFGVVEVPVGPY
jgi:hypothetical protein